MSIEKSSKPTSKDLSTDFESILSTNNPSPLPGSNDSNRASPKEQETNNDGGMITLSTELQVVKGNVEMLTEVNKKLLDELEKKDNMLAMLTDGLKEVRNLISYLYLMIIKETRET